MMIHATVHSSIKINFLRKDRILEIDLSPKNELIVQKVNISTSKLYSWVHWHTLGTRITTPVHHPVPSSANSQALLSTIVKLLLIRITAHQRRVKKYTYFSSIRGSAILYFNRCPFYRIDALWCWWQRWRLDLASLFFWTSKDSDTQNIQTRTAKKQPSSFK